MYSSIVFMSVIVLLFYYMGMGLLPSSSTSVFETVYGHASPISYQPEPNLIFNSTDGLSGEVLITFTETPEPRASSLKVINSNNERVDNNDLRVLESDKSLSTSMDRSKITEGVYTVDWLVLSKDDGHITKGSYVFTIGESANQNQGQQSLQGSNATSGYSKNINLSSENIDLQFDVSPFKAGQNTFNLTALYSNGTGVENIMDVYLEFNNPSKNLGPIIETMNKVDPGQYTLAGSYLSQDGNWEIKMTIQRIGEYDINQKFDLRLD